MSAHRVDGVYETAKAAILETGNDSKVLVHNEVHFVVGPACAGEGALREEAHQAFHFLDALGDGSEILITSFDTTSISR